MPALRRPTLIVMLKVPRAGRVKTRLGQDIGMIAAAWWFRHQINRLLRRLRDPRWNVVLAVTPDREGRATRIWPADFQRIPQGRGELGVRMRRCLMTARGPAVLMGSDIPGVTPSHIARAFRALGAADAVIGPATDGGFWLVGLRHPARAPATLFRDTRWSHPDTLSDTLSTLPGRVAMVDELRDIDRGADLKAL